MNGHVMLTGYELTYLIACQGRKDDITPDRRGMTITEWRRWRGLMMVLVSRYGGTRR